MPTQAGQADPQPSRGHAEEVDWQGWHAAYEQADSPLAQRLALVQRELSAALSHAPAGPIRVISLCAGQGHDLLGVLPEHPRRGDVRAVLVELDEQNVLAARGAAAAAGLGRVEVRLADASLTDSYAGAAPADLILLCGVLGNISVDDVTRTIEALPMLCAADATLIWTRHRNPPDLVPDVRARLADSGFAAVALAEAPHFAVGVDRLTAAPPGFRPGFKLFEFIGQAALWPQLDPARRRALGALFRPDCSLVELVEAIRAIEDGGDPGQTVEQMLRRARGMSTTRHIFLADVLTQRFPQTCPELTHRLYRLTPAGARRRFAGEIAAAVPDAGIDDIHTFATISLGDERIALDVSPGAAPWDGRSPLEPVCGPGLDLTAGQDPQATRAALEEQRCERSARKDFVAACTGARGA